ncbi:hypothetical protein N658DRAFT_129267 [Parathielavia hyrcaniae]|uniref:Uncharacterized protein n=1 Tax=Parathielavia hyrcaniae TaxID=113614 RepID=A0AAN6QBG5_9PEZI|nr:hypothetical protein N658DRAFT_129267 [Parathielavia hyrcaniae]
MRHLVQRLLLLIRVSDGPASCDRRISRPAERHDWPSLLPSWLVLGRPSLPVAHNGGGGRNRLRSQGLVRRVALGSCLGGLACAPAKDVCGPALGPGQERCPWISSVRGQCCKLLGAQSSAPPGRELGACLKSAVNQSLRSFSTPFSSSPSSSSDLNKYPSPPLLPFSSSSIRNQSFLLPHHPFQQSPKEGRRRFRLWGPTSLAHPARIRTRPDWCVQERERHKE